MGVLTSIVLSVITIFACIGEASEISTTIPVDSQLLYPTSSYTQFKRKSGPNSELHHHKAGKPKIFSLGNVTVLVGARGELKCCVENLANYTVSMKKLGVKRERFNVKSTSQYKNSREDR